MNELRQAIRKGDVREVRRLRALSQGTVTAVVDQPTEDATAEVKPMEESPLLESEPSLDIDEPNHPEHTE